MLDSERSFYDVLKSTGYKTTKIASMYSGWSSGIRSIFNENIKLNSWVGKKFDHIDKPHPSSYRYITGGRMSEAEMNALRGEVNVLGARYDADGQAGGHGGFYNFANNVVRDTAWGLVPMWGDDAAWSEGEDVAAENANMALLLEMAFMFCRLAGVEMVSYAEAFDVSQERRFLDNYFPNPYFEQTINDVVKPTVLRQESADGWCGGVVGYDETLAARYISVPGGKLATIRQFHLNYGRMTLGVQARGKGVLTVYYIPNRYPYEIEAEPVGVETVEIDIDSADWREYTVPVVIRPAMKETVDADHPAAAGYHNQVCGLQFTLKADENEAVALTDCRLK
jgi:hypothetical protein